jgi:hypothetical protein
MPRARVTRAPLVDDVPIWDALVVELGDPRPYESVAIGTVTVSDEPCVDDAGFDDAYSAYDDAALYIEAWLVDHESEGRAAVDDVIIDFCVKHDIPVNLPDVAQPITGVVGDLTVLTPAIGTLDQLANPIVTDEELPSW